jgi:archaeosine synthase beta-subunit
VTPVSTDQRHDRAWTLAQRTARNQDLNPFRPYGFFLEQERSASAGIVTSGTILLTNKECPWRCLMCDLWKNTLLETVPAGAIPEQIRFALAQLGAMPEQVKLYNSGSFFDSAAIPVVDYPKIAGTLAFVRHLIVESHPRLVGHRALRLRELFSGSLEVALGLETIQPQVLARLNKKFDLGHFESAVRFLCSNGIAVRAFVLVNPPFMQERMALEWALKSAAFAFSCGASVVTLIPTRGGNGAMERLRDAGHFTPPKLSTLETALESSLNLRAGRVFADTWDLERFSDCPVCLEQRRNRLQTMNLSQTILPRITCPACAAA